MNEQETLVSIDYFEKNINIYTSRSIVYRKLVKQIGKPSNIILNNGLVCGAEWSISFKERKKIKKALSLAIIIMNII